MSTTWIVVADRSRARIFTPVEGEHTPLDEIVHFAGRAGFVGEEKYPAETLDEVEDLVHPESEQMRQELEPDHPGRTKKSPGTSSAYETTHTDTRHQTAEDFAREIVDRLDHARQENQFDRLILVSPPLFLGVLRKKLPHALKSLVAHEIDKDFIKLSAQEIRSHLTDAL